MGFSSSFSVIHIHKHMYFSLHIYIFSLQYIFIYIDISMFLYILQVVIKAQSVSQKNHNFQHFLFIISNKSHKFEHTSLSTNYFMPVNLNSVKKQNETKTCIFRKNNLELITHLFLTSCSIFKHNY